MKQNNSKPDKEFTNQVVDQQVDDDDEKQWHFLRRNLFYSHDWFNTWKLFNHNN